MARTAVPISAFTPNAVFADPAGTAADATNGHIITGCPLEELVLRVVNTAAAAKTATVKAGDSPPALESGQGDLGPTSFADGHITPTVKFLGPFTSGRFVQSGSGEDGGLLVDLEAGFTGTITAFRLPRTA